MKPAIVIVDASRCLGRAAVAAALAARRPVIAVSADEDGLAQLRAAHSGADLLTLRGHASDEISAGQLVAELRALERDLDGVIVASPRPGQRRGRLLELDGEHLRRVFVEDVQPQLAAARALIPLLGARGRNGSYVVIGGPGGEHPWAGYGLNSLAAACVRMLVRVLHDEARSLAVRVHLLAVDAPARAEDNQERACAHWPSALAIGERALSLIDRRASGERADAVVRFAPAATPKSPPPLQPRIPGDDAGSAPMPSLDDTWALLQPLLSASSDKDSRHDR